MLYQQKLGFKDLDQKYFIRRATFCLTALIDGLDKNSNFKHSKERKTWKRYYTKMKLPNIVIYSLL